jgi:hypothetical protein
LLAVGGHSHDTAALASATRIFRTFATDYHINETPMLEQDEHFKHLSDNPTYIRPEDWPEIDSLVQIGAAGHSDEGLDFLQALHRINHLVAGLVFLDQPIHQAAWLEL